MHQVPNDKKMNIKVTTYKYAKASKEYILFHNYSFLYTGSNLSGPDMLERADPKIL